MLITKKTQRCRDSNASSQLLTTIAPSLVHSISTALFSCGFAAATHSVEIQRSKDNSSFYKALNKKRIPLFRAVCTSRPFAKNDCVALQELLAFVEKGLRVSELFCAQYVVLIRYSFSTSCHAYVFLHCISERILLILFVYLLIVVIMNM